MWSMSKRFDTQVSPFSAYNVDMKIGQLSSNFFFRVSGIGYVNGH